MHTLELRSLIVLATTVIGTPAQDPPIEREVRIAHSEAGPVFAGTLTTPNSPGPHPAALLVSPAGEHPRDELRSAGRHLADLAARLAGRGIASLRVDNRGVGASRNEIWPAWSHSISLGEMAEDLAGHLAWLEAREEIDRHRLGLIAHGDGCLIASQVASERAPAFVVLLSPSAGRRLDDFALVEAAKLPPDVPAGRRDALADQLRSALEQLVEDGSSPEVEAALRACFVALGANAAEADEGAAAFVQSFSGRWHREYLGHRPGATRRAIEGPALVVLAEDDPRLDAIATAGLIEEEFRSARAFNARVLRVASGGHFLEPGDGRPVLSDEVVQVVLRFVTDATGFLHQPELPTAVTPAPLAITDVTVVDVAAGELHPGRRVLVREGVIREVAGPGSVPAGVVEIDGRGLFLIPGLWDCHVHLSLWGPDAMTLAVARGVTTVRDMGGDLSELLAWREGIRTGGLLGPRVLLAGPFLDGEKVNDLYRRTVRSPAEVAPTIAELRASGVDFLKVHSALPPDVLREVARVARQSGFAFAGHPPIGVTPQEVSELGIRSIEHADTFLSAMVRAGQSPGWAEARDYWVGAEGSAAMARLAARGTVVVPTLTTVAHTAERLGGVYATVAPWTREITIALHNAGVPIAAGTDSARGVMGIEPGVSLQGELALLVAAGLSPQEALRAATIVPAQMMGLSGSLGEIAVGKTADMVLLRGDPLADITQVRAIAGVVLRGAFLSREVLDDLLARARAARER